MRTHKADAGKTPVRSRLAGANQAPLLKDPSMRLPILLLVISTAVTAQAQQVYKCARGDNVVYQSPPCDVSQRMLKQWDATPEPTTPAVKLAVAEPKSSSGSVRVASAGNRKARPRVDPAEARCRAARTRREAKLQAVGLKRTFDLLRKLDDAVHEACR